MREPGVWATKISCHASQVPPQSSPAAVGEERPNPQPPTAKPHFGYYFPVPIATTLFLAAHEQSSPVKLTPSQWSEEPNSPERRWTL